MACYKKKNERGFLKSLKKSKKQAKAKRKTSKKKKYPSEVGKTKELARNTMFDFLFIASFLRESKLFMCTLRRIA